jgi:hypothetical protein
VEWVTDRSVTGPPVGFAGMLGEVVAEPVEAAFPFTICWPGQPEDVRPTGQLTPVPWSGQ